MYCSVHSRLHFATHVGTTCNWYWERLRPKPNSPCQRHATGGKHLATTVRFLNLGSPREPALDNASIRFKPCPFRKHRAIKCANGKKKGTTHAVQIPALRLLMTVRCASTKDTGLRKNSVFVVFRYEDRWMTFSASCSRSTLEGTFQVLSHFFLKILPFIIFVRPTNPTGVSRQSRAGKWKVWK